MENIFSNIRSFKIALGCFIGLVILGVANGAYHHHKYKCIKGHYEKTRHAAPVIHYTNDWWCDDEILRTEYEKNPNKYSGALKTCQCPCQ